MIFSRILILIAAIGLVACSTESNKKKDQIISSDYDFKCTGNFQVSTFKVTKSEKAAANSYDLPSQKTFNFEACLVDQLNGSLGQPNLKFVLSSPSGEQQVVLTDRRGCVVWSESPKISYLTDETYFHLVRNLKSVNYYKGQCQLEGAFMPWYDDGSSLVDTRYNKLPEGSRVEEVTTQSMSGGHFRSSGISNVRVNLKNASFKFAGLDYNNYEITPLLGLRVAHKYQVRLTPTVIRKTLKKTVVPEALNTGSMKAILVILKEAQNSKDQFKVDNVVTSIEFEDNLLYGDLMADVSIPFHNVVDITSRTVALITLVPKEELEGLPRMSFAGPLSPGLLTSLELKPVQQDASVLHQQYQEKLKGEKQNKSRPIEVFKKMTGYKPINPAAQMPTQWFGQARMIQEDLDFMLTKAPNQYYPYGRELRFALCSLLFSDVKVQGVSPAALCRQRPDKFLNYRVVTFVDHLNSTKPKPVGLPTVDTLKMSMSISTSDSTSESAGYSMKMGYSTSAEIPLSFFGDLKFSIGADYSKGRVIKKDQTSSASISRERSVTAEGVSYEIDVTTRKCFIAASNPAVAAQFPKETKGVYYCSQNARAEKRVETFYLLSSKTGVDGSPITDNASASSSPWKVMIRGTQMLNLFASIIDKPMYELVLEKISSEDKILSEFQELYMNQDFPGVLSEPWEQ